LRNDRIIVNYQNPGLHRGSVPAFLLSGVEQSPYRRLIDLRERETKRISTLATIFTCRRRETGVYNCEQ
jgi:hypothetical protein